MAIKKKAKKAPGELIYGIHPVLEVLKAKKRRVLSIYTTKPTPKAWNQIERVLPKRIPPIQYVTRDVLTRMVHSSDHQGIIAWVNPPVIRKQFFDPQKHKSLLMLERIQDTRNLGAILRSAYCTGVDGVILCKKDSASLTAAAFKASAGLAEHLEIYIAPSAQEALQQLKRAGYNNYLAMLNGQSAVTCEYKLPLCVVIGNESVGIAPQLKRYGTPVTLPQRTHDISYNASVAAGIMLFTVAQKLGLL